MPASLDVVDVKAAADCATGDWIVCNFSEFVRSTTSFKHLPYELLELIANQISHGLDLVNWLIAR
jgi:hypothetical protein